MSAFGLKVLQGEKAVVLLFASTYWNEQLHQGTNGSNFADSFLEKQCTQVVSLFALFQQSTQFTF